MKQLLFILGLYISFCTVTYAQEPLSEVSDEQMIGDTLQLSEVVVVATKKQVNLESGKMVISLSTLGNASKTNAFDALKYLPGVQVRENGTIFLYGKTGVNVMIDDKLTYLSGEGLANLLRSIPASSIEKIELATQPSVGHDASGNSGLIHIQTKKTIIEGVNISFHANVQQGRKTRGSESVNLAVQRNRLNLYLDYSFNQGRNFMNVVNDRYYPLTENQHADLLTLRMDANRLMQHNSHYLRGAIGYELTNRLSIDAYTTFNYYSWKKAEKTVSAFYTSPTDLDSLQTTNSELQTSYRNLTGGVNLLYKMKNYGKWDMSFDLQCFDNDNNQLKNSLFEVGDEVYDRRKLSGQVDGRIHIFTAQSNLRYPLSEKTVIDLGGKTAFISMDYTALYKNLTSFGEWVQNKTLSNGSTYNENINAGYVKLKSEVSSFLTLDLGVRMENTNVKSLQKDSNVQVDSSLTMHYTNLFPNVTAQFHLSDDQAVLLIYGKRIKRPNYRDLNPFIEVNDSYLHEQGNTELKPEFANNIELSYIYRRQYGLTLLYSHRTAPIAKSYIIKDNQLVVVMPKNLRANNSYGARLSLNNLKPFSWWTAHLNAALTYNRFNWEFNGAEEKNNCLTPMVYVDNRFNLSKGWTAEVNGFVNGWQAEGQARVHPIGQLSLGLRKDILSNRATVQLYVEDVLATNKLHIDLVGNMNGWYKETTDTRTVGVSFVWKFNTGIKVKDSKQNNRIEENIRINLY